MPDKICDLLLTADCCLTQDSERRVLEPSALAIDQGVILDLGLPEEIERRFTPKRRMDLGASLLLPGLINAHTHASMTLFRGIADDLPLMEWLENTIWPLEAQLSSELIEVGALLAAAEMTRTGTTCFADMYFMEDTVGRAVEQSGLRAVLGEGVLDFPTCSYANIEEAFDKIETLIETYVGHPFIKTAIACHSVYTNHAATMRRAYDLAERHDLPFIIHLAESSSETDICMERYGCRPLDRLDRNGLLSERTVMAHGIYLQDEELTRISQAGASIVHNPKSNSKLASGMARVSDMKTAGINIALGTDGAASNNTLNMFSEMLTSALKDKVRTLEPTRTPAQAALDMATLGGAKALGLPALGKLERGSPADLIALDLTRPNLQPVHQAISHVVYSATGMEVRLNMVGGEILYLDGHYYKLDWPSLLREIKKAQQWVLARNQKS